MPKESQNKINARWPIYIGEFHNEEHADIKDDLIKFFSEYEKKFPEGNDEANKKEAALGRATGAENYNLYESKYNLHNEKNEAFEKVLKFISKGFLTMSNNANKNYISKLSKLFLKIKIESKTNEKLVKRIINDVKKNGDKALIKYEKKYSKNSEIVCKESKILKSIKLLDT